MTSSLTWLDRLWLTLSPRRAADRMRARLLVEMLQRHYEAAQVSRRTEHWKRVATDANAANAAALSTLRNLARDLVRNTGWARRGKQIIANHTIGWGIAGNPPSTVGVRTARRARTLWRQWAGTTQCDLEGRRNFAGLQRLAMETIAESGEVLIRRYRQPTSSGLAIPLQLQVLEPDHLDATRDNARLPNGGRIIQGVEFDAERRRTAYWLLQEHPGASYQLGVSRLAESVRVPADEVLHVYRADRPGQVRGVTWFAAAIVTLKELDEFEDAELLRQKIAACFAAFVTDLDGANLPLGERSEDSPPVETIEPGAIVRLPAGKSVTMADPPTVTDGGFSTRQLRKIAAALGVTYEDLTGDYSQVNFSSARMARLAHWANVYDWQWNMVIPMLCDPVWRWAMETAVLAGALGEAPGADWTPMPMPIIDPDREALASKRMVRAGLRTPDDVVREQGFDPDTFWQAYADSLARLDALGIVLDSDARKRTEAGNAVQAAAANDGAASSASE